MALPDTILTFDDCRQEVPQYLLDPTLPHIEWCRYQHARFHQTTLPPEPPPSAELTTTVTAYVNAGRWLWQCPEPACRRKHHAPADTGPALCVMCKVPYWLTVAYPPQRLEIEAELLRMPGERWNAPLRHWRPDWTLDYLRERTEQAARKVLAGEPFPHSLSIPLPVDFATGQVLFAAELDHLNDIASALSGDDGRVDYRDSIAVLSGTGGNRYIGLPSGTTAQRPTGLDTGIIAMRYNTTLGRVEYTTDGGSSWQTTGRATHISDSAPQSSDGADGDVWLEY